jgi:hypothetical protein
LECGGPDAAHGGEDAGRFMGSPLFKKSTCSRAMNLGRRGDYDEE